MQHVVIFPTWNCQLSCVYCSIRNSKVNRAVAAVPWQEWARVLPRHLGPGSLVDIAGGEPLLYPGIVDLVAALGQRQLQWALTTNAKATAVIERLIATRPRGCAAINVSDHAGNPEAPANVARLRRAGYWVNLHRVDHPAAGQRLTGANIITYQGWQEGSAVDGIRRHCTAGLQHWVAGPNGDMWRCVVALETGQPSGGNLFAGEVNAGSMECDFGCSACYTEDQAAWLLEMRALA